MMHLCVVYMTKAACKSMKKGGGMNIYRSHTAGEQ
jgi:hypothetical protein